MVDRPPLVSEIADSIPVWDIPKTLKMVVMAALLCAQGFRVCITTDWFLDKWTRRTGNYPRKRRDITDKLLEAAINIKQSTCITIKGDQSYSRSVVLQA